MSPEFKLTKEERAIEKALLRGDLKPASRSEFARVAKMVARRRLVRGGGASESGGLLTNIAYTL